MAKRNGNRVDKDTIGAWGEHLAVLWLRRHGRKVLYRNFRAPGGGEVDIVARHGTILTFVEVKTRTSAAWGRPADAVDAEKQALVLRGANAWLRLLDNAQAIPTRCDIVEVVLREGYTPEITVIEAAFREERW
ncbi:MAG: YraN family protein [Roseimicrobium sp.]